MLDRSLQRKVLEANVYCSGNKNGCQWVGELRHLVRHEKEECGWAVVECSYQCGAHLPRRLMDEHQLNECPQRPIDAKLESFTRRIEKQLEREVKKMETKLMTERQHHEIEIKKLETKLTDEKEQHEREMEAIKTKLTAMETGLTAEREQHEREMKAMETKLTATLETESGRYKKELVTLMEKIEKIKVYCMFVVWTILGLALVIYYNYQQCHLVGIKAQDFHFFVCLARPSSCKQWYIIQRFDQGRHSVIHCTQ